VVFEDPAAGQGAGSSSEDEGVWGDEEDGEGEVMDDEVDDEVSDEVYDKSTRVNEVRRARYYTVTRSLRRFDRQCPPRS
jgi:hypothetical protein